VIEIIHMMLFNGFWIFLGSILILSTVLNFIVQLIKAILRPFSGDHFYFNGHEIDINKFIKERKDE